MRIDFAHKFFGNPAQEPNTSEECTHKKKEKKRNTWEGGVGNSHGIRINGLHRRSREQEEHLKEAT
jgi:hypothetical protein